MNAYIDGPYTEGPYTPPQKPKKALKIVLFALIFLLVAAGGVLLYVFVLSGNLEYNDVKADVVPVIDSRVENILLVGLDVRDAGSDKGHNDLTMVLSLDSVNKKFKLSSIMRDSYVPIDGHGQNRINTSYWYGGPKLAMDTVNKLFGLDIQHYIKVDFFGLAKIIDAMGGITVDEITDAQAAQMQKYCYEKTDVKAGKNVKLSGAEAVAFGRIRKMDSDFQRTSRQRDVFQLLVSRMFDLGSVQLMSKVPAILPNLETNFTKDEIVSKATAILAAGYDKKIEQLQIPAKNTYQSANVKGADVLKVDVLKNKAALKDFIYGS